MLEKAPSFLKMCAGLCYFSGSRWLWNLQASIHSFKDVHGPCLHEERSKHEDLFESLSVYVSVCTLQCAGVNIGLMGLASTIKHCLISRLYSSHFSTLQRNIVKVSLFLYRKTLHKHLFPFFNFPFKKFFVSWNIFLYQSYFLSLCFFSFKRVAFFLSFFLLSFFFSVTFLARCLHLFQLFLLL